MQNLCQLFLKFKIKKIKCDVESESTGGVLISTKYLPCLYQISRTIKLLIPLLIPNIPNIKNNQIAPLRPPLEWSFPVVVKIAASDFLEGKFCFWFC